MNFELEKAVWHRVNDNTTAMNAETALLPERLEVFLLDEKSDAQTYAQLASRLTGADAAALRRISAEEANHAKQLNTLYYLLTGRCTDLKPPLTVPPSKLCEALRTRYLAEVSGAQSYAQAAKDFPAHEALFRELSADETRHSQTVTRLLEHRL